MCSSPELSDKKRYPTFVRTYAQSTKIPEFLYKLLAHFKWITVGILYEESNWMAAREDIKKYFKQKKIDIRIEEELPDFNLFAPSREKNEKRIEDIMERLKHNARSKFDNEKMLTRSSADFSVVVLAVFSSPFTSDEGHFCFLIKRYSSHSITETVYRVSIRFSNLLADIFCPSRYITREV